MRVKLGALLVVGLMWVGQATRAQDTPAPTGSQPNAYDTTDDTDHDGIPDNQDACPTLPRLFDEMHGCPMHGYVRHANGSPDDLDGDTVLNGRDVCPYHAGEPASKGCPTPEENLYPTVITRKGPLFAPRATTLPKTHDLGALAADIVASTTLVRVEVLGHVDVSDADTDDARYQMSLDRAEVVRDDLIAQGVAPELLVARGYSDNIPAIRSHQPLTGKQRQEAMVQNRRVDIQLFTVDFPTDDHHPPHRHLPPSDTDQDGDGIVRDRCPDVVGIGLLHGCPGPAPDAGLLPKRYDNDGDGLPDSMDRCPARAGLYTSGGCQGGWNPMHESGVGIEQQVTFEPGQMDLSERSKAAVTMIAVAMKQNVRIHRFWIESRPGLYEFRNLTKARFVGVKRAHVVRRLLIEQGVHPSRLAIRNTHKQPSAAMFKLKGESLHNNRLWFRQVTLTRREYAY